MGLRAVYMQVTTPHMLVPRVQRYRFRAPCIGVRPPRPSASPPGLAAGGVSLATSQEGNHGHDHTP